MSRYFNLASLYLKNTTAVLKDLRSKSNANIEEIFACSPLECNELKDDRSIDELSKTIDLNKLKKQIHQIKQVNDKTEIWITICCGSFAPIHKSHIEMGKNSAIWLENSGKYVAMTYFIPNNPSYTSLKISKRGDIVPEYLKPEHIEKSLIRTFETEPNLDACFIDLFRKSYCEWFVCAYELMNLVRDHFKDVSFKFAIVGGEDLVRSPGQLYKGTQVVDFADMIMMVPRGLSNDKRIKFPLADDVVVLPEADIGMSSTKVREYLKTKNYNELEKALHPNTLKYLVGL